MYQYLVQVKDKDSDPWQILHGWARPFTYGFTLDDTMDSGKIVLPFSTAEPIVKPFSRVRITINEDGAQVDCIDAPRLPPFHGRRDFSRDDAPPVAPGCVGGKRVAESVRSSGANGGTDSGEGLTAGVGCDKLLEIGKDVMI